MEMYKSTNMNSELTLRILPDDVILNKYVMFSLNGLFLIFTFMLIYGVGILLWIRQMTTFFTNKTTTERFGRKRPSRVESAQTNNISDTTSLLAEKAVDNIGRRREARGCLRWCKNFGSFCCATLEADCCTSDNKIGY